MISHSEGSAGARGAGVAVHGTVSELPMSVSAPGGRGVVTRWRRLARRALPGPGGWVKRGRRPRILLIVENVPLARDSRLLKQVDALVEAGFDVSVICPRHPDNRAQRGVKVRDYRPPANAESKLGFVWEYGYSWFMAALLSVEVWAIHGLDVIQVAGNPDIYFAVASPFKLLKKPIVLDQRDPTPELYEARYGRRDALYHALRWLEKASYRTADHVLAVNDTVRDLAYWRGRKSPENVTIVGNGPVLDRTFRRSPRPELKNGRRYLCCFVGEMARQDRVDYAIRAIDHLVHQLGHTDCQFAFVGVGESRGPAITLADQLGVGPWVSFPGHVKHEEAFVYLSSADLALEPNMEDIVTPVKGMEYMAFELPFVCFDVKETRALADGAALYAARGDVNDFARKLADLLESPELRAKLGRIGRQRIEQRFSWDQQKRSYISVFQNLLDGRAAPHDAELGGSRERHP